MALKITLLEVNDYKRISTALIEPGERSLVLVGGNNTHGKSSLLGAMGAALGGQREVPDDPIRHGARKASIRVVFDDGELVVRRKFTAKGSTLEVTNAEGKVAAPQKLLDQLIGSRFLDPMKFSRLSAIEQRKVLLGCVKMDIDLDANLADEKKAYEQRRDFNREIKKLEARLEDRPRISEVPELVDPSEIMTEMERLRDQARAAREATDTIANIEATVTMAEQRLSAAQAAFIAARDEAKTAKANLTSLKESAVTRVAELRELSADGVEEALAEAKETLASSTAHNAMIANRKAEAAESARLEKELRELTESADDLTEEINRAQADRIDALAAAKMPIDGLSFDDDGLILDGAPFAQASGAEKLRASIAIAWALKPDLCDIWVEDGALLDETSLAMVEQFASENGLRIWLERVGEGDAEAIVMVDGMVKI